MGTRFELVLPLVPDGPAGAGLRAAGEAAIDEIETWHRRLNRFAPDSLVSHLNRGLAQPLPLDRDMFQLFRDACQVFRDSGGAFDVTITPALVRDGAADSAVPAGAGRAGVGAEIELDDSQLTIRLRKTGVSFDLGGIAKGHALDCAATRLRDAGVTSALLHGGTSSVIAIGRAPGLSGWRVALGPPGRAPVIDLEDAALSVSDPSSQLEEAGRLHIADPRAAGGRGLAPGRARAVAVVGPSARVADAWSTALTVLGAVPALFPRDYEARFLDAPGAPVTEGSPYAHAAL